MRLALALGAASIAAALIGVWLLSTVEGRHDAELLWSIVLNYCLSPALAVASIAVTLDALRVRYRVLRWASAAAFVAGFVLLTVSFATGSATTGIPSIATWHFVSMAVTMWPAAFVGAGIALLAATHKLNFGGMPLYSQGALIGIGAGAAAFLLPIPFLIVGPVAATVVAAILLTRRTRATLS